MTAKDLTRFLVIFIAIWIINHTLLMVVKVPTGSMKPIIKPPAIVLATRYDVNKIERYDVVVFDSPNKDHVKYIKRVIGLPGETIVVKNGKAYLLKDTGREVFLDKEYLPDEDFFSNGDGVFKVPSGCYFMMGDNRNHSNDARFWETHYIKHKNIYAKGKYVLFPGFKRLCQ